jgi:hypothetical protein
MTSPQDVVFLLDVDNTLLHNDRLDADMGALLAPQTRACPAPTGRGALASQEKS